MADIKNSGGSYGGVGTSATFLKHFVADMAWAHIDMAGMTFDLPEVPYAPKGASGFGVRADRVRARLDGRLRRNWRIQRRDGTQTVLDEGVLQGRRACRLVIPDMNGIRPVYTDIGRAAVPDPTDDR